MFIGTKFVLQIYFHQLIRWEKDPAKLFWIDLPKILGSWRSRSPTTCAINMLTYQVFLTIITLKRYLVDNDEAEYLLWGCVLVKACSKTLTKSSDYQVTHETCKCSQVQVSLGQAWGGSLRICGRTFGTPPSLFGRHPWHSWLRNGLLA